MRKEIQKYNPHLDFSLYRENVSWFFGRSPRARYILYFYWWLRKGLLAILGLGVLMAFFIYFAKTGSFAFLTDKSEDGITFWLIMLVATCFMTMICWGYSHEEAYQKEPFQDYDRSFWFEIQRSIENIKSGKNIELAKTCELIEKTSGWYRMGEHAFVRFVNKYNALDCYKVFFDAKKMSVKVYCPKNLFILEEEMKTLKIFETNKYRNFDNLGIYTLNNLIHEHYENRYKYHLYLEQSLKSSSLYDAYESATVCEATDNLQVCLEYVERNVKWYHRGMARLYLNRARKHSRGVSEQKSVRRRWSKGYGDCPQRCLEEIKNERV